MVAPVKNLGLGIPPGELSPMGIPSRLGLGAPLSVSEVIANANFTTLNTSTPTYACGSGSFDPYTKTIKYVNQRRQRPIAINGTTYQADLIEALKTNLLAAGTSSCFTVTWTTGTGAPTITDSSTTGVVSGDTDAASFIEGVANGEQSLRQSITKAASSLAYAGAIFVKNASGTREVVIELDDGTTANGVSLRINPATGALTAAPAAFGSGWALNTTALAAGYQIESYGSGWYRVTLCVTSDAATTVRIRVALWNGSTTSYAGDGTSGIYVYGADVAQQNWSGTYVSNRNLIVQSENLTASWTKTRSTATGDVIANPLSGETTADLLTEDTTASSTHFVSLNITRVASATITLSVYAKPNGRSFILLSLGSNNTPANGAGSYFDITNGLVGSTFTAGTGWAVSSKAITSAGSGWYRCTVVITTPTGTAASVIVRLATADGTSSYSGDGVSGAYLYGFQPQYGTTLTTYWANSSSGSGVRNNATLNSSTAISSTAGTLLVFIIPYGQDGASTGQTGVETFLSSSPTSTYANIQVSAVARLDSAAVAAVSITPALAVNTLALLGLVYNSGGFSGLQDGSVLGSSAAVTLPYQTVTGISLGYLQGSARQMNGYVLGLYSATVVPGSAQALIFAAASAP